MPAIFETKVTRRSFLQTTALGAATLAVAGNATGSADEPGKTFRVALLSDTHIPTDPLEAYRGFKPVENLKRITPEVIEAKPELVIINGDAARLDGKVSDYQALQELLKPIAEAAPVCIGLGNHDDRVSFGMVFKAVAGEKQKVPDKHVMVIEHEVARIAVLDSLLYVNKVTGLLGKAQRTWLANWLPTVKDRPVVLFVHHTLGDEEMDFQDVDRLFAILQPNPHVKAIFYGHSHQWVFGERQGVKLINLPAVAYNFNDTHPLGWVNAAFRKDGCELTLRAFAGNTGQNGKKFDLKWV